VRNEDVRLPPEEFGGQLGKLVVPLSPPVLDEEVLALDIAEIAQSCPEGLHLAGIAGWRGGAQEGNPVDLPPACCASAASGAARMLPDTMEASMPFPAGARTPHRDGTNTKAGHVYFGWNGGQSPCSISSSTSPSARATSRRSRTRYCARPRPTPPSVPWCTSGVDP
jgi:hypothetical protein